MKANDPSEIPEETLAPLLESYDAALATGRSATGPGAANLSVVLRAEFEGLQACLRRLERAWPRSAPGGAPALPGPILHAGPARLGRYRLIQLLGGGGFGLVYLAWDPHLRREVAIKVPRPETVWTPEVRARLIREAQTAAGLDHPHLVPIYEVGEAGPAVYLVSAYCPGPTLEEWLNAHPTPVPVRLAAEWLACLADAVRYMHARGVLHRDLKPANILLAVDGGRWAVDGKESPSTTHRPPPTTPKITDFGLAKDLQRQTQLTRTGAAIGTPAYMAPEQAEGRLADVGPATDVYALGVILYRVLTGRVPFVGANELDAMRRIVGEDPLEPRRLRPDIPLDLQTVCLKCLRKEPGQRYAGAGELAGDLRRFLRSEPVRARPVSRPQRAWSWARRRPTAAALLAVSAAALLGLALGVWWHLDRLRQSNSDLADAQEREGRENERANASEAQVRTEKQRAAEQARMARRYAYVNAIRSAARAADRGQPWRAVEALNRLRPRPGEPDPRGLEWYELWRRCRREALFLVGHSYGIHTLAFTPNGQTLASGSEDLTVKLWDTTTGQVRTTLHGHPGIVECVAIAPDGQTLASVGGDNLVRLWDLATGQPRAPLAGHRERCTAVAFSPDGRWLASGGTDRTVRLWDLENRREHLCLRTDDRVFSLAFSADGRRLATAGEDGVTIWDVPSGKGHVDLKGHTEVVRSVAFSPDGQTVASGGGDVKTIRLWDVATAQVRHTLRGHTDAVTRFAFTPDGKGLVSGSEDRTVRLWDVATGQECSRVAQPSAVRAVAVSPDGHTLAWGGLAPYVVTLHDLTRPPPAPRVPSLLRLKAWCVAFSPDGRTLASGSYSPCVTLWDTATGQVRRRLPLPWRLGYDVYAVAYAPDGRTLAAGTGGGAVILYDAASGTVRYTREGHRGRVRALAFAPDGDTLASASRDGTVKLWDPTTGRLRHTLEGHRDRVDGLAFAPNGQALVSGGRDDMVRLWDSVTGQPHGTHFDNWTTTLAFSPDGRTLVSGNALGLIKLRDWPSMRIRKELPGHPGGVGSLAFTPDGQALASAGIDKTIRLWDMATELELLTLTGHTDEVNAVAFSPDGKVLASANHDGTVRFWRAAEASQP